MFPYHRARGYFVAVVATIALTVANCRAFTPSRQSYRRSLRKSLGNGMSEPISVIGQKTVPSGSKLWSRGLDPLRVIGYLGIRDALLLKLFD